MELKRDGSAYSDIAILYRASYLSRSIEQALMNRGVSYVIWGGIRFFERKEIKDAISYLRLISAPEDDLSFKRICNVPSRKIGKVAFQKIQDISRQCGCSLYEALKKGIDAGTFKEKSISGFVELVEECRRRQSGMAITDLLDYVLENGFHMAGYLKQKALLSIDDSASQKGKGKGRSASAKEGQGSSKQADKEKRPRERKRDAAAVEVPTDVLHPELYNRLVAWRNAEASALGLPVYLSLIHI